MNFGILDRRVGIFIVELTGWEGILVRPVLVRQLVLQPVRQHRQLVRQARLLLRQVQVRVRQQLDKEYIYA